MRQWQLSILVLGLLGCDWACDTHFGNDSLSRPMSSSQVILVQARGQGQELSPIHCPIPPTDLLPPAVEACSPLSVGLVIAPSFLARAFQSGASLIYLFMTLLR